MTRVKSKSSRSRSDSRNFISLEDGEKIAHLDEDKQPDCTLNVLNSVLGNRVLAYSSSACVIFDSDRGVSMTAFNGFMPYYFNSSYHFKDKIHGINYIYCKD
jgi:hypothetical protein